MDNKAQQMGSEAQPLERYVQPLEKDVLTVQMKRKLGSNANREETR